jgi:hypothetical protein
MAHITLAELNFAGSELFQDSESYLNELSEAASLAVNGGYDSSDFGSYTEYGVKYLEFLVAGYGIATVKHIAKSFSDSHY